MNVDRTIYEYTSILLLLQYEYITTANCTATNYCNTVIMNYSN